MIQGKHSGRPKKRVWRITESAPLGEVIDPDELSRRPKSASEVEPTAWAISSLELKRGVDVNEDADTVPAELFDELFRRP